MKDFTKGNLEALLWPAKHQRIRLMRQSNGLRWESRKGMRRLSIYYTAILDQEGY